MKDSNYVPNSQKQTSHVSPIKREESKPEKDVPKQDRLTDQCSEDSNNVTPQVDDTVPDPFGSYEAPPVLVSRPRTSVHLDLCMKILRSTMTLCRILNQSQ